MSAHAWETATEPARPAGGRTARPHLVLVPGGVDARGGEPALRLTRRGRLVVSALVALVVVALVVLFSGRLAAAAQEPRAVIVKAGQTLSEIAARELPSLTVNDGVVELQLANSLSSPQVHAGQTLLVPSL